MAMISTYKLVSLLSSVIIWCLSQTVLFPDRAFAQCKSGSRPSELTGSGKLESPNYPLTYPSNSECQWRIKSTKSSGIVALTFIDFYTEDNADFVYVYDDSSITTTPIAVLSGPHTVPFKFESTQRYLMVRFISSLKTAYRGFNATYSSTVTSKSACSASTRPLLLTDGLGIITSRNFPNNYDNNANCEWRILSELNTVIRLQFTNFCTSSSHYVRLYDGKSSSGSMIAQLSGCRSALPDVFTSTQRYMFVSFTTYNYYYVNSGFSATYAALPECSLELRAWGYADTQLTGYVRVNGATVADYKPVYGAAVRGLNTMILEPNDCSTFDNRRFDTTGSTNASDELTIWINGLRNETVLLGVSCEEIWISPTSSARAALSAIGVDLTGLVRDGGKFAFVAVIGRPTSTAYQVVGNGGENAIVEAVVVGPNIVGPGSIEDWAIAMMVVLPVFFGFIILLSIRHYRKHFAEPPRPPSPPPPPPPPRDDEIPRHWVSWTREQHSGIPQLVHSVGDRSMRSPLTDPSLRQEIETLVSSTWDTTLAGYGRDARAIAHTNIEVEDVWVVENPRLLMSYQTERARMRAVSSNIEPLTQTLPYHPIKTSTCNLKFMDDQVDGSVNEYYLFHGTTEAIVDAIERQGFEDRLASPGLFGKGMYFAECSTKADQYADVRGAGRAWTSRYMLVARVLLGNVYKCDAARDFRRPPCKGQGCNDDTCITHELHDSVLGVAKSNGRPLLFRELIVYDRRQCYPDYIIKYKRI